MATSKFRERRTPGVYVTELDAFPPSIVGVQTAVPAFIGYTEKASIKGHSVVNQAVQIRSLADYEAVFGRGFEPTFKIIVAPDKDAFDFEVNGTGYLLEQESKSNFYLYYSMRLFFANGGGTCYIVSVGDYTKVDGKPEGVYVDAAKLEAGLKAIADQVGPTMLVVPDATLLPTDGVLPETSGMPFSKGFQNVTRAMLKQSQSLQDRVAILDVYGTQELTSLSDQYAADLAALIEQFHIDVSDVGLNYGMGYIPFLQTSVVDANEIDYTNIAKDSGDKLTSILGEQAKVLYLGNHHEYTTVQKYIDQLGTVDRTDLAAVAALDQHLTNALPVMNQIKQTIAQQIGVLPPSGAMAGLYALNDQTRGVWNAPANYSLTSVVAPTVNLNNEEQGEINVPLDGKAVNAIRAFPGRGTVVWGARTLDGNSNDWRYIQVRRTIIYIEQSIKNALDPYVFAPNDGNTWVRGVSSVSNFLQDLWTQGGLMGATASEAFSVECGLGSTMTAQDILDGYMIVQVTLQMIRPAEFIKLTFRQKMEGSS